MAASDDNEFPREAQSVIEAGDMPRHVADARRLADLEAFVPEATSSRYRQVSLATRHWWASVADHAVRFVSAPAWRLFARPSRGSALLRRFAFGSAWRGILASFVCGVAAGGVGVVLLMPRTPSEIAFAIRFGGAVPVQSPGESSPAAATAPVVPPTAIASLDTAELPTAAVGPTTAPPDARMVGGFRRISDVPLASPPTSGSRPAPQPAQPLVYRGSLAVNSSPQGAEVFVNAVPVGVTPLLLRNLSVGSRVVRVELAGHERWSSAVQIVVSERTTISATLRPLQPQLSSVTAPE